MEAIESHLCNRPECTDCKWYEYDSGVIGADITSLNDLLAAMSKQANSVVWNVLHQRRPDIVNDCLLRAVKAFSKFRGDSKFSTWFHRIVVNRCKTVAAKEARQAAREAGGEEIENVVGGVHPSISLGEILSKLTGMDWRFAYLKLVMGNTDTEIGSSLALTPAQVRSTWRRIRKKLREVV